MKEASSAFDELLRRPLSCRERGDHRFGRARDAADTPARSESGWFENTASAPRPLLKITGAQARWHPEKTFP